MNRVARHVAVVALIGCLSALSEQQGAAAMVCGVVLVVAAGYAVATRRGVEEQPWSAPTGGAGTSRRLGRRRTSAIVRALARVEAREIVWNPWFTVGLAMGAVMVTSFAPTYDGHESWGEVVQDLPFLAHPLVGMAVVAAHRCATRSHRDDAAELFAATPAASLRPAGVVASAWVVVATLAAFMVSYLAMVAVGTTVDGSFGAAAIPTLLAAACLGAGGVALGVALARWVPLVVAPVVALVAIGYVSLELGDAPPGEYGLGQLLSTFGTSIPDDPPELTAGQGWLHLLWLVAITLATAAVVLIGRGDDAEFGPAGGMVR